MGLILILLKPLHDGDGIGCLISSPTAIIFGKRLVYLFGVLLFLAASIWCAASQSYGSLVASRIVMGVGVAPREALPSAAITEIFFLHERACRVGIYTLLLLGGKTLVPLVSAVINQALNWSGCFGRLFWKHDINHPKPNPIEQNCRNHRWV